MRMAHLHVKATVDDYEQWKSDFESYHAQRAEHGGQRYQLFQSTDDPNEISVLIEFTDEESARGWTEYLEESEGALTEPDMSEVETTYLTLVEQEDL